MPGELKMNREEMVRGFLAGRTLTQEEWAHPQEIEWANELISAGVCRVTRAWGYSDNFQCSYRKITGVAK